MNGTGSFSSPVFFLIIAYTVISVNTLLGDGEKNVAQLPHRRYRNEGDSRHAECATGRLPALYP